MITTLQEVLNGLKRLSLDELEDVKDEAIECIDDKIYEAKKTATKTRSEIIKDFNHFGFQVPDKVNFWKIRGPLSHKGFGAYGMEVGRYVHSCHVDTTDLIVLLVVDGNDNFVESYSDMWLDGPV